MKKLLFIIPVLALTLAACGQMTPPTEDSSKDAAPTAAQTLQATANQSATIINPDCRVVAPSQPNPTIQALLPKVGNEWSLGPENASITVVEYGDFQ